MEGSPVCDDQAFLPATYIQQYHQDSKFQDQKEWEEGTKIHAGVIFP